MGNTGETKDYAPCYRCGKPVSLKGGGVSRNSPEGREYAHFGCIFISLEDDLKMAAAGDPRAFVGDYITVE